MSEYPVQAGRPWTADKMRPEDAEGVARLFRFVYGDDYPVQTYTDPERLIEANRSGEVLSSVARTDLGDVVGHNAVFHSAPSPRIFESGSGLVHREYRGQNIFQALDALCVKRALEEGNAAAVWGEPVLNHPISQKMTRTNGYINTAVEVDLMPAATYAKEQSAAGRVSTLMGFILLQPSLQSVYLPPVYENWLGALYDSLGAPRETLPAKDGPPEVEASRVRVDHHDFAQLVRAAVHEVGADFEKVWDRTEAEAAAGGVRVFQVWLRLTDPAVGWAVDRLRRRGFFFGGLLPRWFDDDGLLMQKTVDPPHWNDMVVAVDDGRRVIEMAKQDWAAAGAG
jgi:hypothetical protein